MALVDTWDLGKDIFKSYANYVAMSNPINIVGYQPFKEKHFQTNFGQKLNTTVLPTIANTVRKAGTALVVGALTGGAGAGLVGGGAAGGAAGAASSAVPGMMAGAGNSLPTDLFPTDPAPFSSNLRGGTFAERFASTAKPIESVAAKGPGLLSGGKPMPTLGKSSFIPTANFDDRPIIDAISDASDDDAFAKKEVGLLSGLKNMMKDPKAIGSWMKGETDVAGNELGFGGGYYDDYGRSMTGMIRTQGLVSAADLAMKGLYGMRVAKDKFESRMKPVMVPESQVTAPVEAIAASQKLSNDQTLASGLYSSREGGNGSVEGLVATALKNDLMANAQKSSLMASLYNENQKINLDVRKQNAQTQMGYFEYQDALKWGDKVRKEAIYSQLISGVSGAAIPLLQNKATMHANLLQAKMND